MAKVLDIIPATMSASLAADNFDFAMKTGKKSLVKQGIKNIVGANLIGAVSNEIAKI